MKIKKSRRVNLDDVNVFLFSSSNNNLISSYNGGSTYLNIISKGDNNLDIPWGVEATEDNAIKVSKLSKSNLLVTFPENKSNFNVSGKITLYQDRGKERYFMDIPYIITTKPKSWSLTVTSNFPTTIELRTSDLIDGNIDHLRQENTISLTLSGIKLGSKAYWKVLTPEGFIPTSESSGYISKSEDYRFPIRFRTPGSGSLTVITSNENSIVTSGSVKGIGSSTSEIVDPGTEVTWSAELDGYKFKSGVETIYDGDIVIDVEMEKI